MGNHTVIITQQDSPNSSTTVNITEGSGNGGNGGNSNG